MAKTENNENTDKLTFEEAIKQLTDIVSRIESGRVPLQTSIEQYERGMALIKHCRKILQSAEKRIEKISIQQKDNQDSEKADKEEKPELF
ncbi:MAG: exodeoxyribonuclease VII small subunit [Planctomycetota bacterium]